LQSQLAKTARKRLSLSGLELLHGRLVKPGLTLPYRTVPTRVMVAAHYVG
jgi:hypothetical protein